MKKGLENELAEEAKVKNEQYLELVASEKAQKVAEDSLNTTIQACRKELQEKVKASHNERCHCRMNLVGDSADKSGEGNVGAKMDTD